MKDKILNLLLKLSIFRRKRTHRFGKTGTTREDILYDSDFKTADEGDTTE